MKPVYFLKSAAVAALFLAGTARAQMDSCNVFLQGNHVEIGISPSGSYGSSVFAPAGYHPHGPVASSTYHPCDFDTLGFSTPLGFVADPLLTGWSTDSASHYMGDYFLPGDPFEGWSIQIGDTQFQAFNTTATGYTGSLTGENTAYYSSVGYVSSTWVGEVDSIQITQITTLDSGALYFTTQVIFTNLSSTPVNDIYYFRSVDPDNDETWSGGGFPTTNTVVNQGPDTNLVTAYGATGTWTTMGLGTLDTNCRSLIYSDWPLVATVNLSTLYNGTFIPADYTQGTEDNGDLSIGLVYHIAHLASVDSAADSVFRVTSLYHRHPANSESITYFYAFGQLGIDSALANLGDTASLIPTAVKNVNTAGNVKVFPNPSSNVCNVSGLDNGDMLTLYDMMGRQLLRQQAGQGVNTTLSLNTYSPGAYILVVTDANGNMKSRVPVQKL